MKAAILRRPWQNGLAMVGTFAALSLPMRGFAQSSIAEEPGHGSQTAAALQPYDKNDPQNYSSPAAGAYEAQRGTAVNTANAVAQNEGYGQQNPGPPDNTANGGYGPQDDNAYEDGQEAVEQAPPPLPEYNQPEYPGDGYIWTPGYWAYGPAGYDWMNGAWVQPPYLGALWTPGYWGFGGPGYFWNAGYWGPGIGFYGGINYGYGYFGNGFCGGYWNGGVFNYNRAYTNVGSGVGTFYNQRYPGVGSVHPQGRSFTTVAAGRGAGVHAGTYNVSGRQVAGGAGMGGLNGHGIAANGFGGTTLQRSGPAQNSLAMRPGPATSTVQTGAVHAGATTGVAAPGRAGSRSSGPANGQISYTRPAYASSPADPNRVPGAASGAYGTPIQSRAPQYSGGGGYGREAGAAAARSSGGGASNGGGGGGGYHAPPSGSGGGYSGGGGGGSFHGGGGGNTSGGGGGGAAGGGNSSGGGGGSHGGGGGGASGGAGGSHAGGGAPR